MQGGRLFPIEGDWYEWRQDPPLAAIVTVRVVPSPGGRLVLTGLRIDGEPTAELLRTIPVGRIEAAANAQLVYVGDATATAVRRRPRHASPPARPGPYADGWETTDPARFARRPEPGPRTRGRPDTFYREVASAYLELAQASPRPVADLATAHDIPSTTAHRWVKEARRRGFLPPGRPGKAG